MRNWAKVGLGYARSKNLTPYDVLTIASMVEGETPSPEERPLVAAVIYNRLHEHMALQIDATLRYGLHIPPTASINGIVPLADGRIIVWGSYTSIAGMAPLSGTPASASAARAASSTPSVPIFSP